ncbi:mucin-2 [Danio aesculapii]|uniref:mucin-2 n=1 Tax=Danio aesculapii TaxID=1142201 RepID=UPI0024BF63F7|nr:mucin-2 [Danio aesculapii]XP_056308913.1 mucin-2 [Danio aesculapii]
MKPDGVDTASMEPMEALNAGPAIEVAPVGEAQEQALPATEAEPQPTAPLSATNKTGKEKPTDPKAKTKAPAKTKTPIAGTKATTTSSRPPTGQSRLTNGAQKSQANGVTKKPTTGSLDKKTSTTAGPKKTVGSAAAATTKTPTKVAEKKPLGTARPASAPANGVKTTGTAQPIKKTPAAPANGLKPKPKTTAPAPRPATASTTKSSTTDAPKPSGAKTTRSVGSVPATRSSPAASKPATLTTATKTPTSTSRPTTVTPKTPSTTAKPSPAKTTAPPSGRTPTPKTTTPVKKDVSKLSSTPAPKKTTSSPLTRPATSKTTKPDTPKSASTAKAESASKKPTTTSKAADVKPSKPKESKATPSKEVSASPKTTGTKPSTKTSSPKKTVGSSTPMSLKGGPKASVPADTAAKEAEKKDIVPAVVAATTAAAAIISVVASEGPEDSTFVPAGTEEVPEDLSSVVNPAVSEVKLEESFTTPIPAYSKDSVEMATPVIPPPTTDKSEDKDITAMSYFSEEQIEDRTSDETPEETGPFRPHIHPASEETPEDITMSIIPPTSYGAPEVKDSTAFPLTSEEIPEDTTTSVIPPTSYEERQETISPVILPSFEETQEHVTSSVIRPTSYEERQETVSPVINPTFEDTREHETTSFFPPTSYEAREETVSPVIPHASEETPEHETTSVIPPTSYEARKESVSPAHASEEIPEVVTTPTSYEAPEQNVIDTAFDEEPEDTDTPVISPTPDNVELTYAQDTYRDNTASFLFAAEVDQEESVPAESPLGTTVLSPPSSPTGPISMPVEIPTSSPFQDLQGAAEPWAQSSSLFPHTAPTENQEQDEESGEDDEKEQEDIPMSSAAQIVMGDFEMLGSAGGDRIRPEAPVSAWQEREEAVEKAEEEINEDNDEEEEEEEEDDEEDEVREIGIEEPLPQTEKEDDFKKGVTGFASSDWGMMQSDDMFSSNKHDSEGTSPFSVEDKCIAKETGGFAINEADGEQPFTGPPGIQSFGSEDEEEDEEEDLKKHMDLELDAEDHKQQEEQEKEDEDVEMIHKGMAESGVCGNDDDEDDEEDEEENQNYTEERCLDFCSTDHNAPATTMPSTTAWSQSNPFSDSLAQPASFLSESSLSDTRFQDPDTTTTFSAVPETSITFSADPDTPPKSPAPPLIQASEPQIEAQEETVYSIPAEPGILGAPVMSQSSTLSGTALVAHSSSETSTPEELRDYDSSSGVESRSDKQQTPVPAIQTDMEQDLGIHLERGDGEEEEAETLPADEILGDAATAPASVPSSPSTSGDEASDTEGEMQINDPNVVADDKTTVPHNLSALEEDEEAHEHIGEEDGDTPQSANSVASYGFDCSASISNAHSMAESCGKSPGIFSLENEEQLPEEAKDPSFIKELTLPAATAYSDDLLGCPVDLLPINEPTTERDAGFDEHYMLGSKTDPGTMEEMDPESPMHLSPQHGDDTDGQPPYYSAICDKTDNFLAGNV